MAHLVVVAIEECEEARLCPCGAFNATETEIVPRPLDVAEVPEQFLQSAQTSMSNNSCWT